MLRTYNTGVQNKQALIGIAAAFIILLGAGGVFLYSQNKPKSEPNSTTATENVEEESNTESDLSSILKSGKTQQCNFSYDGINGATTTGIAYLSGDKMRTDVSTMTNGKSSTVYVIRNGDNNFIWGTDFPNNTGMKMTLSIDEYTKNENSKKYFDPSMKTDYKCESWTVDSSVFTPPSNVKFQDLSQMMQGIIKAISKTPSGGTTGASSECSICNSLTGDAKTACMKQFSC